MSKFFKALEQADQERALLEQARRQPAEPLQLLAYYLGVLRDSGVDHPHILPGPVGAE